MAIENSTNEIVMKVYDYICKRSDNDIVPTIREICADLGISSTSTAHKYVNMLCEMNLIQKQSSRNRALKVTNRASYSTIPVVGTVTAGIPITAIENIDGYISFASHQGDSKQLFALKVRGDSMIGAAIIEGDTVIVCKDADYTNGDIVVAMLDSEEATVKRFFKEDDYIRLQPENANYAPIISKEVTVLGRVIGIVRYL